MATKEMDFCPVRPLNYLEELNLVVVVHDCTDELLCNGIVKYKYN